MFWIPRLSDQIYTHTVNHYIPWRNETCYFPSFIQAQKQIVTYICHILVTLHLKLPIWVGGMSFIWAVTLLPHPQPGATCWLTHCHLPIFACPPILLWVSLIFLRFLIVYPELCTETSIYQILILFGENITLSLIMCQYLKILAELKPILSNIRVKVKHTSGS